MRALQKQYIVDVFVWIDDLVTQPKKRGQQPVLRDSELLTILIWDGLTEPHKNLSSVYSWIEREYGDCFPKLPAYQNFVAHCHRLLPTLVWLLQTLLANLRVQLPMRLWYKNNTIINSLVLAVFNKDNELGSSVASVTN